MLNELLIKIFFFFRTQGDEKWKCGLFLQKRKRRCFQLVVLADGNDHGAAKHLDADTFSALTMQSCVCICGFHGRREKQLHSFIMIIKQLFFVRLMIPVIVRGRRTADLTLMSLGRLTSSFPAVWRNRQVATRGTRSFLTRKAWSVRATGRRRGARGGLQYVKYGGRREEIQIVKQDSGSTHKILSSFSSVTMSKYGLKTLRCHHFMLPREEMTQWGEMYLPHRSTSWWRAGRCPWSTCPSPPHTDPRMIWMARSEWSWCPCRENQEQAL